MFLRTENMPCTLRLIGSIVPILALTYQSRIDLPVISRRPLTAPRPPKNYSSRFFDVDLVDFSCAQRVAQYTRTHTRAYARTYTLCQRTSRGIYIRAQMRCVQHSGNTRARRPFSAILIIYHVEKIMRGIKANSLGAVGRKSDTNCK